MSRSFPCTGGCACCAEGLAKVSRLELELSIRAAREARWRETIDAAGAIALIDAVRSHPPTNALFGPIPHPDDVCCILTDVGAPSRQAKDKLDALLLKLRAVLGMSIPITRAVDKPIVLG